MFMIPIIDNSFVSPCPQYQNLLVCSLNICTDCPPDPYRPFCRVHLPLPVFQVLLAQIKNQLLVSGCF